MKSTIQFVSFLLVAAMLAMVAPLAVAINPPIVLGVLAVSGVGVGIHHLLTSNHKATASQFGGIAFSPVAAAPGATDMTAVETTLDEIKDFLNPASPSQLYHDLEIGDNSAGSGDITTDVSGACHLSVHGYGFGGVSVEFADGTNVEPKALEDGEVFDLPLLTNREVYPDVTVTVEAGKKAKVFALSRDAVFDIGGFASVVTTATVQGGFANNGTDALTNPVQLADANGMGITAFDSTFADLVANQLYAGLIVGITSIDSATIELTYDPAVATVNSLDMSFLAQGA